ncbi:MFS transporter [Streptomyces sp. CA-111067]|uniref:MFS transporter n=1 Tax=Streptomyces sp. CA-111067 TaxID=3240046 RepID=UPI003D99D6B4
MERLERPERPEPTARAPRKGRDRPRLLLTAALCAGYFLVLLDVTVVNVALPQIGSDLHAVGTGTAWVVDAYAVPLAALLLASGAIGDRLGHRPVVIAGFAAFGAASVACALAPTIAALVAARAVQGVGAALMLPGTLVLLVETTPDTEARARLVGVWAAIGGAALPAGPVLGGLLVQSAGWRAVFWLSVPVIALALVPVVRLPGAGQTARADDDADRSDAAPLPGVRFPGPGNAGRGPVSGQTARADVDVDRAAPPPVGQPPGPGNAARAEGSVDRAGAALLVVGLGCAVTAIIQARGALLPAALLALGALCAGGAFWRVERSAARPLVDVPRGVRRMLGAACLVGGVMNLCVLGSLFLLTQLFQDVRGLSPLQAGLGTLPAMLPLPLLGAPAGRLIARIGVRRTSAVGLLGAAAGFAGIAVTVSGAGYVWLLCSLALWGAGLAVLTPAIVSAALQAAPGAPGVASGASNTSRQTGGALGVAIFGAAAGAPAAAGFAGNARGLFLAAAAVFILTAVLYPAATRSTRSTHRPAGGRA